MGSGERHHTPYLRKTPLLCATNSEVQHEETPPRQHLLSKLSRTPPSARHEVLGVPTLPAGTKTLMLSLKASLFPKARQMMMTVISDSWTRSIALASATSYCLKHYLTRWAATNDVGVLEANHVSHLYRRLFYAMSLCKKKPHTGWNMQAGELFLEQPLKGKTGTITVDSVDFKPLLATLCSAEDSTEIKLPKKSNLLRERLKQSGLADIDFQ